MAKLVITRATAVTVAEVRDNMTESEVIEKLRAYHKCQRLQVKGIYEDCNEKLCDNCDLCYMQGTAGEHIKSIEIAIQALEKQMKLNEMGDCYIIPKNGVFEVNGVDVNLAIQKQIANKPILKHDVSVMHINRGNKPHEWKRLESDNWHCPECDSFVGERVYVLSKIHDQRKKKYCDNCGQKLNWESDEE